MSNEDIVHILVGAGVSVVAITDHHIIDVGRITELQGLATDRLVVLPGIEVRTELGGSDSVHMVAVLPEDCNLAVAWDTVRTKHKLIQQVEERGHESVYVRFSEFARDIHDLGGLVLVHAGSKANSIEEIANSKDFKQWLKTDLARQACDIFEIANAANIRAYRDIVFPAIKKDLPLVMCSDSHALSNYAPPLCWLKADPSFYGLRQVIYDPWDRVYLGRYPPALTRTEQDKTKYIASISFGRVTGSDLLESWFDEVSVPLNLGLVAIIGNKGSGKSALAEAIGLLGGCRHTGSFSFLHPDRFLQGRRPRAAHFEARLEWLDSTVVAHVLSGPNDGLEQRVRYIPQNYLETVCNALEGADHSEFGTQLEEVILSHVPPDERAGHDTLQSLIDYRASELEDAMRHKRERILCLNDEIAEIQYRLGDDYRTKLATGLDSKRRQLEVLDGARPQPVTKPPDDPTASPETRAKTTEVERIEGEIAELESRVKTNLRQQSSVKQSSVSCEKLLQAVDNFEAEYRDLVQLWDSEGRSAGVKMSDVLTLQINRTVLEQRIEVLDRQLSRLAEDGDPSQPGSLAHRLEDAKQRRDQIREELSAPEQAYQRYVDEEKAWAEKRQGLVGDGQSPDTIAWYEARLEELNYLPAGLTELESTRIKLVMTLYNDLEKERLVYEELYQPVQRYIDDHPIIAEQAQFQFAASIRETGLTPRFFEIVHQGRRGSFFRDGEATLRRLVDGADFGSGEGVLAFVTDVLEHLQTDKRNGAGTKINIEDQLKDGMSTKDVCNLLFSLEYLRPTCSLRWAGKDLELLSPGEKGALLLVFYLLIDRDTNPLLIDQPEENLDNQTVFGVLVPCVNEARRRRQIVLVTHNPNLAVACDADQVIRAELDAEDAYRLSYKSGAIENPNTTAAIVDVLEGTKRAFRKREHKYHAAMPDWLT